VDIGCQTLMPSYAMSVCLSPSVISISKVTTVAILDACQESAILGLVKFLLMTDKEVTCVVPRSFRAN